MTSILLYAARLIYDPRSGSLREEETKLIGPLAVSALIPEIARYVLRLSVNSIVLRVDQCMVREDCGYITYNGT